VTAVVRGRRGEVFVLAEYPAEWWALVGERLDAIAAEVDEIPMEATA